MNDISAEGNLAELIAASIRADFDLLSMLPSAQRDSLARCAAARVFTGDMYRQYLCVGGTELSDLVARGWVERSGGPGPRYYWIAGHLHDDAWDCWWQDIPAAAEEPPPSLRELCAQLAGAYQAIGWPVDQLRQLAIADPQQAARLFRRLYREADRRFELAHCQDLVDALCGPAVVNLLPRELRELRDGCQLRISARAMRATDYYQTRRARYQPRRSVQEDLAALLTPGPEAPWLAQLYGRGGIGKSTLLHWFIARQCVVRDPLVACALINCDALDPAALLERPWLVLLEAADQLNPQLHDGPFRDLLLAFGDYQTTLFRSLDVPHGPDGDRRHIEHVGQQVEAGFCQSLAGGPTILLALDALDEVASRSQAPAEMLRVLVGLLSRIQSYVAGVRVVLAGREDLRVHLPDMAPAPAIHRELPGFDAKETVSYLRRREVTDRPKVRAIAAKSEGLPMVVALYADLLEHKPQLTAEEISRNTQPQVEYLISRILLHIPDPVVRASLLYSAAIPDALDFEFFCDVMLPLWRAEVLAGGIVNELDPARPAQRCPVPDMDDREVIGQLWKRVMAAAEAATWISVQMTGGHEAINVHPEVRSLLRARIKSYPTAWKLHDRAAGYCLARADACITEHGVTDSWIHWTKAALYHCFHAGHTDAAARWRGAVAQARTFRRLDWVYQLAFYLLDPNFHDPAGRPDFGVLTRQALYEAHVELARVAAQNAGRLPGSSAPGAGSVSWRDEADRALTQAAEVRSEAAGHSTPLDPTDYEEILSELVRAERENGGADPAALAELAPPCATASGDAWLVRARTHVRRYGSVEYPAYPEVALAAYQRSIECHTDAESVAYVAADAAQWLLRIDRPDLALAWCDRAEIPETRPGRWAGNVAEIRAEALLTLGRPASALAVLETGGEQPAVRARCLAAEAQLALRRPEAAVTELTDGRLADAPPEGTAAKNQQVEHELLLARAYGELLDLSSAEECFNRAQELIGPADEEYQARISTARAVFQLRVAGNVRHAAAYLAPEFDTLPHGQPTWTTLWLARAELADRQKRAADVREILEVVRRELIRAKAPARSRVMASLHGLAARSLQWDSGRRDYLADLIADLRAVVPAAQLAMLAGLSRCQPVTAGPETGAELASQLRDMATATSDLPEPPDADALLDQAWRDLALAQVLRVTGGQRESPGLRARARWALRDDPFIRWDLLAADAEYSGRQEVPPDPYQFHLRYSRYPLLIVAFVTEWADQYDRERRGYEAGQWLEYAGHLLRARPGQKNVQLARYLEVLAERARCCGEPKKARERQEAANEVRADLDPERDRTAESPPEPAESGPQAVSELTLSADLTGHQIQLRYRHAGGDPSVPSQEFSVSSRFTRTNLGIGKSALEWGHDAGAELGQGLRLLAGETRPATVDVRAQFPRPGVAAYPWELASVAELPLAVHPSLRYVYRSASDTLTRRHQLLRAQRVLRLLGIDAGRIDGIAGPAFFRGLAEFHRQAEVPVDPPPPVRQTWQLLSEALRTVAAERSRPLRITLIQPMVGGTLDNLRKLNERMHELARAYQAAFEYANGVDRPELRLRVTTGGEMTELFAGSPSADDAADVLHVCTVMEATEQMPVLGLDARSGPPLTAPELDLLVRRLSYNVPPLVVVDVQAPPGPVAVRQQLLMRNRFCHQLLALGSVSTVIATGLAGRDDVAQWGFITRGLAERRNAADICRSIQQHECGENTSPNERDVHAAAFTATALFTSVPADMLTEPGLVM